MWSRHLHSNPIFWIRSVAILDIERDGYACWTEWIMWLNGMVKFQIQCKCYFGSWMIRWPPLNEVFTSRESADQDILARYDSNGHTQKSICYVNTDPEMADNKSVCVEQNRLLQQSAFWLQQEFQLAMLQSVLCWPLADLKISCSPRQFDSIIKLVNLIRQGKRLLTSSSGRGPCYWQHSYDSLQMSAAVKLHLTSIQDDVIVSHLFWNTSPANSSIC